MKIKKIKVLLVLITVFSTFTNAAAQNHNRTLENLQAAYNGESNARAKYLEFAKQADTEGYGSVGSLFRAASKAEDIHRNCEADAIKSMGAVPQTDVKAPAIKSTKQNLEDSADKGEAYECDTMYPKFIRQAARDNNKAAARCFRWARDAEAEHFNLFTAAARNLDKMKEASASYYFCSEAVTRWPNSIAPNASAENTRKSGKCMRLLKLGLIAVIGFLAIAQAFRIERSNPPVKAEVIAPPDVKQVMERSCYSCHSNETIWPWYSAVAPISWLLAHDVHEGRGELNFSLWEQYDASKRNKKLREIGETVAKGEMPPWYYVHPMHTEAKLSESDRKLLATWAAVR